MVNIRHRQEYAYLYLTRYFTKVNWKMHSFIINSVYNNWKSYFDGMPSFHTWIKKKTKKTMSISMQCEYANMHAISIKYHSLEWPVKSQNRSSNICCVKAKFRNWSCFTRSKMVRTSAADELCHFCQESLEFYCNVNR